MGHILKIAFSSGLNKYEFKVFMIDRNSLVVTDSGTEETSMGLII